VLVEHCGGAFPVWLAPEQMRLVTVSERFNDYAEEARTRLVAAGVRVQADLSSDKLGAKIRQARLMRVPYIGVIGEREAEQGGVALRSRDDNADLGLQPLDAVVQRLQTEALPPSERNR
jgi:threonyl-tRNA synthetase